MEKGKGIVKEDSKNFNLEVKCLLQDSLGGREGHLFS